MTDDLPDVPETYDYPLVRQADDILDEDTDSVELCASLDVHRYERKDPYGSGAEPFEPMFRARLLQLLNDHGDPELVRQLENPEVGEALGFDPDSIPNRSTFQRARTNRFGQIASRLETIAERIRRMAARRGSSIGAELVVDGSEASSSRHENRLIRRRTRGVIDEMEHVVFPEIDLPRPDDPVYSEEELLKLEALLAIKQSAANGGADEFGDLIADLEGEIDLDAPFYEDGPTGETLLTAIKNLSPEAIAETVNHVLQRILIRAKPYEDLSPPIYLALDITYVRFDGETMGMERIQGAPDDKEYEWCHKFATISVVGDNHHFCVGMLPVGGDETHDPSTYPGPDRSYRVGNVVRQLLDLASELVDPRCVFADREFYAADTIAAFEEHQLNYVVPARETERVRRFLDRMDDEVTVKHQHGMFGPVKHGVPNERVQTKLVGLPPDETDDSNQVFITNLPVDDEIDLDRRRTRKRIERYRKRGGIENAYKKTKEFAAWTTSRAFEPRLFHFGFAVIAHNMWLLVDFLVQHSVYGEVRSKPRLTASRFRGFLDRRLPELI